MILSTYLRTQSTEPNGTTQASILSWWIDNQWLAKNQYTASVEMGPKLNYVIIITQQQII